MTALNNFRQPFDTSNSIELAYFHCFYTFVTRELFNSKTGGINYDGNKGRTELWGSDLNTKIDAGEILKDLKIIENNSAEVQPTIQFEINQESAFSHNFRQGDIVIVYILNSIYDSVNNQQIFKGTIKTLTSESVTVQLRFQQPRENIFLHENKYAIEHDFMDTSYNAMFKGLYSFLQSDENRKKLLLMQRPAEVDNTIKLVGDYSKNNGIINKEINEIVLKAKQAKDIFLLIGPPGTGKTSVALKAMVNEFYLVPLSNILLLAYTNRAVDEICEALEKLDGNPPYIRIGSELSCNYELSKNRILDKVIEECTSRECVRNTISNHRIFVGTVSSLSGKMELFKLKHFQVAIIDEASQLLEPTLLGLFSAKDINGNNAIDKFILIGDHKQLPAVVLQDEKDTIVINKSLNEIGLTNCRYSLFERFFNKYKDNNQLWAMLYKQGRMHKEIALFPSYYFYESKLTEVPLPHQNGSLNYHKVNPNIPSEKFVSSVRLAYIPSEKHELDKNNKTNTYEAIIVKKIIKNVYDLYKLNGLNFSSSETIGIITPYRNQIALIKKEIETLKIPQLNEVTVDTIERLQGSQRDIIIFSICINSHKQLNFLTSNSIFDAGQLIDRKLNVALTRAKKQLFILGNPSILSANSVYFNLIEFIRSKGGFLNFSPQDIIDENFNIETNDLEIDLEKLTYTPSAKFGTTFDSLVIQPLKLDSRTPKTSNWHQLILGNDNDFNRMNLIGYGRADFSTNQESLFGYTLEERVNLYCYYNMRKHYFTTYAIYSNSRNYFEKIFNFSNQKITFIDVGCGPLTSGLAFHESFKNIDNFSFNYIGIDISHAMLSKAKAFSSSGLFNKDTTFLFETSLNSISDSQWEKLLKNNSAVIFNFSYLFGNLSTNDSELLANKVNQLLDGFALNNFIIVYQNSSIYSRNRSFESFKKLVPRFKIFIGPNTETVTYKNSVKTNYDSSEKVLYQLLKNY